ncbi:hypothetical protein [Streptomyces sp. ODS28]|uniref:hypothetical protein n=1 Tax=Streptomyces sp. ODS28 TaxID=3136688 RepID=UPI0031E60795
MDGGAVGGGVGPDGVVAPGGGVAGGNGWALTPGSPPGRRGGKEGYGPPGGAPSPRRASFPCCGTRGRAGDWGWDWFWAPDCCAGCGGAGRRGSWGGPGVPYAGVFRSASRGAEDVRDVLDAREACPE